VPAPGHRGYLLTQVAGGVWADKFGGKPILGFGVIWWSIATALTPIAAQLGLPVAFWMLHFEPLVIADRAVQQSSNIFLWRGSTAACHDAAGIAAPVNDLRHAWTMRW
jgi:MFS family permease